MCIFRKDSTVVCRSIAIDEESSYNIVKESGVLTAHINIGNDTISLVVVSEDSAKSWVQNEIYKRKKKWVTL